jgi:exodeoxyribonuclease V alpha subunit
MTTIADPAGRHLALGADGPLAVFNRAEVLEAADVHVAQRLGALAGESDADVLLAVALVVRAARLGSVCLDLGAIADQPVEADEPLPWPASEPWRDAVARSSLTRQGILRVEGSVVYLDRHWREERQVCDDLLTRLARHAPEVDEPLLEASADRLFTHGWEEQRRAAVAAARRWTTVLTGGPGTGKTASVARLLVLVAEQHEAQTGRPPRIALAAPTGKAATRLEESVARETAALPAADQERLAGLGATTVHRLLGWRPDSSTRFRHHRENPLPYDVVVIDEVSMVSLSQMARLLEAVRPTSRLLLVGDPDQLSSVEAGAVLADLVGGFEGRADSPVLPLTENHRTESADLDALAAALRTGDADATLRVLRSGSAAVRLVDPADAEAMTGLRQQLADAAYAVNVAADRGDGLTATALLDEHRLLCAHRRGPYGVTGWNREVERLLSERTGITHYDEWYSGRPVLITANDRGLRLSNGDLGVTVHTAEGKLRVMVRAGSGVREFAPTRLSGVETVHAMTVHKSQGSEARVVTVILPPEDSPLLTRELFYTAVTRARESVRVVGTEDAVRAAVGREVQRASGLAARLTSWASHPSPAPPASARSARRSG